MIYTFGDGFAAGHIWPEWPQFLEVFTNDQVTNHGVVGAGNELIFNTAIKQSFTATSDDVFLVQWAMPVRFDKILETPDWHELQKTDEVYRNNRYMVFDNIWWPTSGSALPEIRHYHNFYVQRKQAVERSVMYMLSLSGYLTNLGIAHHYFSTYDLHISDHPLADHVNQLPWVTTTSMETWSRTRPDRGDEIQPSPMVHYKFVEEFLLPTLNITVDPGVLQKIERRVQQITPIPFYYDHKKVWTDFKDEVSLFFK